MIKHTTLQNSFRYAIDGISHAMRFDQNFRIHLFAAFFVLVTGLVLQVSRIEMILLGIMIVLVITVEMINTTIENMVDLITKEHREEARIAKDVASGMVLVTSFGAVIVGIMIFTPYLLELF